MIIGGGRKNDTLAKNVKREIISPLLMYNSPPDGKLEFDEFASVAIERFSGFHIIKFFNHLIKKHSFFLVLQLFETIGARYMKGGNDYLSKLDTELRKLGFLRTILCGVKNRKPINEFFLNCFLKAKDTAIDEAELNKDIVSHFILRLAFCQT